MAFFETSFGRIRSVVILVSVDGGGRPASPVRRRRRHATPQTHVTAWHILKDFLAPLVLGRTFDDPRDVFPALTRVRGHRMAKAAVEMAAWDLAARQQHVPLTRLLGGTRAEIASGVSIGIQDSFDQLLGKVEKELAAGYQRIKIKIKPGWDIEAVERIRAKFGGIGLQVDANAAYTLGDAALLARLDPFDLLLIEQPLDYDDVMDHVELQRRIKTPIGLDESIHTVRIARRDRRRRLQDHQHQTRTGRRPPAVDRTYDLCAANDIPVWHGGMLGGIGRAHKTFTWQPAELPAAGRHCRQQALLPARPD